METRNRKRTEATTSSAIVGPTTRSNKRPRVSSTTAAAVSTLISPLTRTRTTARSAVMDSNSEPSVPSGSTPRSRRGKKPTSKQELDKDSSNSEKGKGKEPEIRPCETGRGSAMNIELHDEGEDDIDNDVGGGIFHQNFTSASSALQGLLRKLGAGLDDLLPTSGTASDSSSLQNGRFKKVLSGLRADGGEGRQVEALLHLCDILSIGTEESLSTFSVDSFVPVLVGLLNHESNPDIMLFAARALTHLVDVLPSSCAAVVHYGAVSCFVSRLLTIEYMDLAEQSLQALKKISQEHPTACLRAGALMAVLSYLDFFSTGMQRVALETAAHMCNKLPSDAADFVMEAVPLLTNLLQYHDAKVLESASICLTQIAHAFASSPEKLDELCNHGLVTQAATLISSSNSGGGQFSLSSSTYTGFIRLLSTCARSSSLGAKSLLLLGISGVLKDILSGSDHVSNMSVTPALSRPPEQIFEIVNLANELLPPLPQGTIPLPVGSNCHVKGHFSRNDHAGISTKQEESNGNLQEVSKRVKMLTDQPEVLRKFGIDLLPVMVQIHGSGVNGPVRDKCFSVIVKLMYFCPVETIQSLITVTNMSSFLAGVLAWKQPHVLLPAIQVAEILMEKLPDTFSKMFVREGVVHAVDTLILVGSSSAFQPYLGEKDSDLIPGSSKYTRRNRCRGSTCSSDAVSSGNSNNSKLNTVSQLNPAEIPTSSSSLWETIFARAQAFKEKYFPCDPEAIQSGDSDDFLCLKNLSVKLNSGTDELNAKFKGKSKPFSLMMDVSSSKEEKMAEVISEILRELSVGEGVSNFEFLGSGLVDSLLNYFTCGCFSNERISDVNIPTLRKQAIRRYQSFVTISLPFSVDKQSATVPISILVAKLQSALSFLEHFPVFLSHASRPSGGNARLYSGLIALTQPFKLCLCRDQAEKSLRDYSSNIVLIDPLARLAAVEDFLWPRVKRNGSSQKSSVSAGNSELWKAPIGNNVPSPSASTPVSATQGHSTRLKSSLNVVDAGSSKGSGKALLNPSQQDAKGPQTRQTTRRRATIEKEIERKAEEENISSEGDELDISPIEIDEDLVIEEDIDDLSDDVEEDEDEDDDTNDAFADDTLPICGDEVHDVKFGDSDNDSSVAELVEEENNPMHSVRSRASPEFHSVSTFGARSTMSFAAAAMAGRTSGNNRGVRGGRDSQRCSVFGSSNSPKLIFTAGGRQLNRNLTVYQAIQRQVGLGEDFDDMFASSEFLSSDGSRLWHDIYTITYQRAHGQSERPSPGDVSSIASSKAQKSSISTKPASDKAVGHLSLLDSILRGELPCDMERSNPTYNILALLRVLEGLNQLSQRLQLQKEIDNFATGKASTLDVLGATGARVPAEDFINSKLTSKMSRQIQNPLALCSGSLPSWCLQLAKTCPFLFPFETRRLYFYSTAFGLSRALHRLQQQQGADGNGSTSDRDFRIRRLRRHKVRVSRNRILDSAVKVMEMHSSKKSVLEVEYFGEEGTGLGPTLEFYTLLSHEFLNSKLCMWRLSSSGATYSMEVDIDAQMGYGVDKDIIHAPLGLFPRPWPQNADTCDGSQFSKVLGYYRLLGQVMAKTLQDGRLMDLPLSTAFCKLILAQDLDLHDIASFDVELWVTLQEMQALVQRKEYLDSRGGYNLEDLCFRGASVEDLYLDFTLPGYPDYVLKPGSENVDLSTLGDYVSRVVDATIGTGIMRQMEAFRSGFNQVSDISSLQVFSPKELDVLLCGRRELWKGDILGDHIKFDHGYTSKSPVIINLLEIMGEFRPHEQRAFCQFVTGAPHLPPGGLAVLKPKLTIVRKHWSGGNNGGSSTFDDDLPSVMTCANYLKLPPYSTKEILLKKLMFAVFEGRGSFDLS